MPYKGEETKSKPYWQGQNNPPSDFESCVHLSTHWKWKWTIQGKKWMYCTPVTEKDLLLLFGIMFPQLPVLSLIKNLTHLWHFYWCVLRCYFSASGIWLSEAMNCGYSINFLVIGTKLCYFIFSIFVCGLFDHTAEKLGRIARYSMSKQNSGCEIISASLF